MRPVKSQRFLLFLVVAMIVLIAPPAYAIHQPHVQVKITASGGSSVTVTCGPPLPGLSQSLECSVSPASGGSVTYAATPKATVTKNSDGSLLTVKFPADLLIDGKFKVRSTIPVPNSSPPVTQPQGECVVKKGTSVSGASGTVNQIRVQNTKVINQNSASSTGEAGVTVECNATIGLPDSSSLVTGRAHSMFSTGNYIKKDEITKLENLIAKGDDHTANGSFVFFSTGSVNGKSCLNQDTSDAVGGYTPATYPSGCQGGRALAAGAPGTPTNTYAVSLSATTTIDNQIAKGFSVQITDHNASGAYINAKCVDFFGANATCQAVERLTASLFYNLANPTRNGATVLTTDRVEITGTGASLSGPSAEDAAGHIEARIPSENIEWHGGAHQAGSTGVSVIDFLTVEGSDFNPASIVCDFASSPINVPVLIVGNSSGASAIDCIDASDAVGNPLKRVKWDAGAVTNEAGATCDRVPEANGIVRLTADFHIAGTQVNTCGNNPNKTCTQPFDETLPLVGEGWVQIPINPCK